jgi:hypothetical protein
MSDNKAQAQVGRRLSFAEEGGRPGQLTTGGPQPPPNAFARKQSVWNANKAGAAPGGRRLSYSMSHSSRKSSQDLSYPRIRLQNTYRMEPGESEKFKPYKVEPKLYALLEETLKNRKYDPTKSAYLCKELSKEMMSETRLIMNNASMRYKLVAHVVIGEMSGQDLRVGSRCLWDNNQDNCVTVVYKNSSLYAVATVFAIYYE